MNAKWSPAEVNFVKANAAVMSDRAIAATLTRLMGRVVTLYAVRHIRQNLGLAKKSGRGKCELLRRLRPNDNTVALHVAGS